MATDVYRVVFLDVDGVLHPLMGDELFVTSCMERLKRIIDESGARIVLSSSWRQSEWGVEEVNSQLMQMGMAPVIDSTPVSGFRSAMPSNILRYRSLRLILGELARCRSRSDEILDWVFRHPAVTHFAQTPREPGWADADLAELSEISDLESN